MAYIHFTEQEKQTANSVDLVAFLKAEGETLKRAGREYVWQAPSGKVSINGSQWYSQYEQTGGGAILFVRNFFGMSFPEAVSKLLGHPMAVSPLLDRSREERQAPAVPLVPPPKHTDMRRVYGYLTYERLIDREIIHAFAHEGLLYEDAEYHNAVFVGKDDAGEIQHIHKRSKEERHIVSVFKIIQELLAPSGGVKGRNQFQLLMEMLPADHKAKWFAGAALNTAEQSMASVMSTTLSRLNTFLDSELETILCNDTEIDAEEFCNKKSAIFIIMPEEDSSKYFMVSLIIQQLYREILAVADENKGRLKNRVVFYCDEFGTLPKIESAEMMFSASRSRRVSIVPIIQSFAQLEKNYGKEGAEIIIDNTQLTVFGGFAPNSQSAQTLSNALGNRTVLSGSVSQSQNEPSRSLTMMQRPLLSPDELKSLPKGTFVVTKTGFRPMQVKLKLFFEWGIEFDEEYPYIVPERETGKVRYACKEDLVEAIYTKYPKQFEKDDEKDGIPGNAMPLTQSRANRDRGNPPRVINRDSIFDGAAEEKVDPQFRVQEGEKR